MVATWGAAHIRIRAQLEHPLARARESRREERGGIYVLGMDIDIMRMLRGLKLPKFSLKRVSSPSLFSIITISSY